MSAQTDRGLALARAFIANIDEWDGEPMPGQRWHKEYTAAKELIRAAEIDASKPECPTCSGRGEIGGFVSMDSGYQSDPCPECSTAAHAEAVEALPELVAEGLDYFDRAGDAGDKAYVKAIRKHLAALAARPAAVGGEVPTVEQLIAAWKAATQPQQLAVTDEAVSAFIGAIHWLRLPTHSQEEVRVGITAALPHLARKETSDG